MKLELERQNFLKAWQIAERVVGTKTPKDSISGILINASDNEITLEATDLKTAVKCKAVGANVIEAGSAVIPAAIFGSMLKKAADDLVLEVNSSRGVLHAGRNKMRFSVIPTEEFPQLPNSESAEEICTLVAKELADTMFQGGVAASQPQDFPRYMGTCLFKTEEGSLKVVSTDGKRLAISKITCENIVKDTDMLLPASATKELAKTLDTTYPNDEVKIFADDSTVWFKLENVEFSIRKIDATFPTYQRILNRELYTSLRVKKDDFIKVLERIDIIARTNPAHIMAMTLNPENGEVRITARSPEHGTVNEVLSATIEHNYLQIGFNVAYFIDGLKSIQTDEALIEFSSEEGQARMYRGDNEDFLYMLMPARLSVQDRLTDEEIGDFTTQVEEPQPLPTTDTESQQQQEQDSDAAF